MISWVVQVPLMHPIPCPVMNDALLLFFDDLIDSFVLLLTPVTVLTVFILSPVILAIANIVLIHILFLFINTEK